MANSTEISLRHFFAGLALQGLLSRSEGNNPDRLVEAVRAYEYADAMIEAETISFIHYVKQGNTKRVKEMLAQRKELATMVFDISTSDAFKHYAGSTAIETALHDSYRPNKEVIQILLEYGADPKTRGRSGKSAVEVAAQKS